LRWNFDFLWFFERINRASRDPRGRIDRFAAQRIYAHFLECAKQIIQHLAAP
jgi:hypothetical protein